MKFFIELPFKIVFIYVETKMGKIFSSNSMFSGRSYILHLYLPLGFLFIMRSLYNYRSSCFSLLAKFITSCVLLTLVLAFDVCQRPPGEVKRAKELDCFV